MEGRFPSHGPGRFSFAPDRRAVERRIEGRSPEGVREVEYGIIPRLPAPVILQARMQRSAVWHHAEIVTRARRPGRPGLTACQAGCPKWPASYGRGGRKRMTLARERACSISAERLSTSSSYSSRLASLISEGRCWHSFKAVLTSARSSQRALNSSSSSNKFSICFRKAGNRSRTAVSPRECDALSELDPITSPRRLRVREIEHPSAVRQRVAYYTRDYRPGDGTHHFAGLVARMSVIGSPTRPTIAGRGKGRRS